MPYISEEKLNAVLNLLHKYGEEQKAKQWHQKHRNISDGDCSCRQKGVLVGAGSKGDSDDIALGFGYFIKSVARGRAVPNCPEWVADAYNRALSEGSGDASGGVLVPEVFVPELLHIVELNGVMRKLCRVVPMMTDTAIWFLS